MIDFHKKEAPFQGSTGWGGGATGLRMGGAPWPYTDAVWFKNAATNSTAIDLKVLELYNVSTTETVWKVPAGVTSISVACMGSGGGGRNYPAVVTSQSSFACGGGQLVWRNGLTVTPGQTLYVHAGGTGDNGVNGMSSTFSKYVSDSSQNESSYTDSAVTNYSRASYVRYWNPDNSGGLSEFLCFAGGAKQAYDGNTAGGSGGITRINASIYGTLGSSGTDYNYGNGGAGGGAHGSWYTANARGAGGAGGWSGSGGSGSTSSDGSAGSGGGAGGGAACTNYNDWTAGRGGDTFMWGEGNSGSGGAHANGSGGDGSATGGNTNNPPAGLGEGGGGYRDGWIHLNAQGPAYDGWVRIAYSLDGTTRNFPSTNVGYPG